MLWIEYRATEEIEVSSVRDVLKSLAKIISPFPVCAYDRGDFGVGMMAHDDIQQDNSSSEFSIRINSDTSLNRDNEVWESSSLDHSGTLSSRSNPSTLVDHGSSSNSHLLSQSLNADTNGIGNTDVPSDSTDIGAGQIFHSGANGDDTHDGSGKETNQNGNSQGDGDDNDDNDDNDGDNDDDDPPSQPSSPQVFPKFDTFAGTGHLQIDATIRQDLDISFDLQIEPNHNPGTVDCVISLENFIVQAGSMYTATAQVITDTWQDALPYYVSQRAIITFSPSGKCRVVKNPFPLRQNYADRNTINTGKRAEGAVELSAHPKATIKLAASKNQQIDQIPPTLSVKPRKIGAGSQRDFRWDYDVTSDAETYLELSSRHPPMHRATYPLQIDSDEPSNVKVRVEVIYGRQRIDPRTKSARSIIFRFLTDVGVKHLLMTLEATIYRENGDYFQFPTANKRGCEMELDLEFQGRKIGYCPPQQRQVGDDGTAGFHVKSHRKK